MKVIPLKQGFAVDQTPVQPERRQRWLAAGGVLGALASSSCCILPVALFSLGASGAWLGKASRRSATRLPTTFARRESRSVPA